MPHGPIEPHRPDTVGLSPFHVLPGLATALDGEAMRGRLQAALFGTDRPNYTIERCIPARPLYVPGEFGVVRYRLWTTSRSGGTVIERIVTGRVHPDQRSAAAYMRAKVAPLVDRVRHRPDLAPFTVPATTLDDLAMVVQVWPIDGDLPTLVDATDPVRMVTVFRDGFRDAPAQPFDVEHCQIELVSYRRRGRCVLRYTLAAAPTDGDAIQPLSVYGKVSATGDVTLIGRTIDALRTAVLRAAPAHRFTVPRVLASSPDLHLSLLEAVPGEARIGAALKAQLRGKPAAADPPLEEMIATGGRLAAVLHGSGVDLGPRRGLEDELTGLRREIATVEGFAPEFAARARSCLDRIAQLAETSEPLRLCLAHGDFKPEQVLFDGATPGLVDFDQLCQAEPALDLGKFVALVRWDAEKIQRRASVPWKVADELVERFLGGYVGAFGGRVDESALRQRTMLYEAIALLRLALRSQLDLDDARVEMLAALLERQIDASEQHNGGRARTRSRGSVCAATAGGRAVQTFTRDDGRALRVVEGYRERVLGDRPTYTPRGEWDAGRYEAAARKKVSRTDALLDELAEVGGEIDGARVLDMACGDGINALLMARRPVRSVVGIDLELPLVESVERHERTRRLATEVCRVAGLGDDLDEALERLPLQFIAMDATETSFDDDAFDVVVSRYAIEHIRPVEGAFAEIARVTRPGGLVHLSTDPYFSPRGCHKRGVVDLPWAHARLSLDEYRRFVTETEGAEQAAKRTRRLETLNQYTIGQWREKIEAHPFDVLAWREQPSALAEALLEENPEVSETVLDGVERRDLLHSRLSIWLRRRADS